MSASSTTATLDDKYALERGRVYLTGTQALVRLLMVQQQRDRLHGLNTAGFVSGYRGSPLGGLDQALWKAKTHLERHNIRFQPGLNEDLAATAVWGSQQVGLWPGAQYDGVFGLWYGKGPGVDRSGDVFKHANFAGTAKHGGVLVIAGDDHASKSSTLPHQTEYAFMDAMIPVLNPANVQEILDLGVFGWELSRYSGCWITLKTIAETVDSSASVYVDPERVNIVIPQDFALPPGGLHIRWPDKPLEQEQRLARYKLYAALAFAKANRLNRVVLDSPNPRFGIVTTGKSYLDVLQALDDLGIDEREAAQIGLRVYKVGMSWPLERDGVREFAEGLEEVLVVEEKRAVIENQFKEQLYNWREDVRPRVIGKFDEQRHWILPSAGELTPAQIARVIAERIGRFYTSPTIQQRLAFLEAKEQSLQQSRELIERTPHFCSGCPHNTSTKVPDGSRAMAGIGCHYMVTWMDRHTDTFTQMGGEGVTWIGQAPFTNTEHVFQNLGDGTYFHSGSLAIRAALAAKVNITYKILYNDAVAMTGGQPVDGNLSVAQLTHQLYGEGVRELRLVSDDPEQYASQRNELAQGVQIHHRDELDAVQRELRQIKGVSVLIYQQTCATEKRRRRKRGLLPDPQQRVFINSAVCEGCGDCGVQSNCLSVVPLETEFGRKRAIDQSNCNKDFSCVKGFCPSFVSVMGGQLRKAPAQELAIPELPTPQLPDLSTPFDVVITGVGGTGVVTLGALLGMAAHLEHKGVSVLDMTGLAQKYGAVVSHVRIAAQPEAIHAVRIAAGNAKLLLGCDLVVAAGSDALSRVKPGHTHAVLNTHASMPALFTRNPDARFPTRAMLDSVEAATGSGRSFALEATALAEHLLGDALYANPLLLGYAWQRGLLPLSAESLLEAIALNGTAVAANQAAFHWGRYAAVDLAAVQRLAQTSPQSETVSQDLDSLLARRMAYLSEYQNTRYAQRYQQLVARVRQLESERCPGQQQLSLAVARYASKLLAYKDEYEVARLYSNGEFARQLAEQFSGEYEVEYHLAPPWLPVKDAQGQPRKLRFGPWVGKVFTHLAKLKVLRGTPLDVFGYSAERRMERQLISDYWALVDELLQRLTVDNHALAVQLASLPEQIRGFGHVKQAQVQQVRQQQQQLLALLRNPGQAVQDAAA